MVREQFQDYWSYLRNVLIFDCRNTSQALPDLPPPPFDRELMRRLLHYAEQDAWGRERRKPQPADTGDIGHYLERVLPEQMRQSPLSGALPNGLLFGLDVGGAGGGCWSCHWADGALSVRCGADAGAAVTYRLEATTLAELIQGRRSPQSAFFDGLIEMDGDMEKALKLAQFIEQFLAESLDTSGRGAEVSLAVR